MPLAARIDDGDRRPQAVPPHPRVPVVEPSWAPAHLYLALSESGSGDDNNPDSFSRASPKLIPFFGFTELAKVFGAGKLEQIFFRRHHLRDPPKEVLRMKASTNRSSWFARWDTRIRKLKLVSVSAAVVLVAAAPY